MCFSAQLVDAYREHCRRWGAFISLDEFKELYGPAFIDRRKIPKMIDQLFIDPQTDDERAIKTLIDRRNAELATEYEQELFKQRTRLADAERKLAVKETKAAAESKRIATDKVEALKRKLDDLRRTEPKDRDARIFPGIYAPVIVSEGGKLVVKPMRYQCRPAGKPAFYDIKYPGTYNARRDNLEGFWKGQFGHTHGLMIVKTFYENVDRDGKNVVLQFTPDDREPMLVACLWSRWTGKDEPDLLSFAAITDDPPPEVAAAGHDRCIVQIKPENVTAWLNPDPKDLAASYAILDDRPRPYYEHRLAA
jgi:putative SOS response-associated peptidase YedK